MARDGGKRTGEAQEKNATFCRVALRNVPWNPRPVSGLADDASLHPSFAFPGAMPSGVLKDSFGLPLRGQRRSWTGFPCTWGAAF
jgi:hypothetical protein